jgi:hypothetical protein
MTTSLEGNIIFQVNCEFRPLRLRWGDLVERAAGNVELKNEHPEFGRQPVDRTVGKGTKCL